jgi:hypothetical protein
VFWGATSAAAPVIALAAVVAIPDASFSTSLILAARAIDEAMPSEPEDPAWTDWNAKHKSAIDQMKRLRRVIYALGIDIVAQALLLGISLAALATGQNTQNTVLTWAAIFVAFSGILLLAWAAVNITQIRYWAWRQVNPPRPRKAGGAGEPRTPT